jgi:cell division protein FtsL
METQENKTKKQRSRFFRIINGEILTEDFVVKQSKLIIMIVFLILIFISNRYACMKKLTEIETLTTQLKDVKYENLVISTELTTHSRQSQVEELLNSKGIKLASSKSSVYEIHK